MHEYEYKMHTFETNFNKNLRKKAYHLGNNA